MAGNKNKEMDLRGVARLIDKEQKEWRENIEVEVLDLRERIGHLERRVGIKSK